MNKKKFLINAFSVALAGFVFFFLGRELFRNWEKISSYSFQFDIGMLALASAIYAVSFLPLSLGWHLMLKYIKNPIPFFDVFLYFCITQPAKYIPGKIWIAVTRMKFCRRHNVPNAITFLTTGVEAVIEIFAGAYISLIAILQTNALGETSLWGTLAITAAGVAILHPKIFYFFIDVYFKITKHELLPKDQRAPFLKLLLLQAVYIASLGLISLSQLAFLQSFAPVEARYFPLLIGVSAFTHVASILAIFTPGGLGVREGIWYLALKRVATNHVSLIFSFASRIWMIVMEAVMLFIAMPMLWLRHRSHKQTLCAQEKTP